MRHLAKLESIIGWVRRDAPALSALRPVPDGKYVTRPRITVSGVEQRVIRCLAKRFQGLRREEFPVLYCAWGKARVGSTALANLFGVTGIPAYYQPVKAIARQMLTNSAPRSWDFPPFSRHPCIFSKETAGPYSVVECLLVPLRLMVDAGYPADRLHLVLLDRDPASSFASWLSKWSHLVSADILLRHYVIAALNAERVEEYARRRGISITHYVYEATKEPVLAARSLFGRLGLAERFSETAVTEWQEKGQLGSENCRVIYPMEPPAYAVPGLHGSDTGYRYHPRSTSLTDAQREVLRSSGVEEVYWKTATACANDLGFDAETARRLFGVEPRIQRAA